MIKELSYSAYILPVRNGQVALLKYGENGYGPIGGRLDDGEDFLTALRRELTEELGRKVTIEELAVHLGISEEEVMDVLHLTGEEQDEEEQKN